MFFIFLFFCFLIRLKSRISITTKPTNMNTIFFLACALSGYIFVNPFTSCVTDRYQHKQCIIMDTESVVDGSVVRIPY